MSRSPDGTAACSMAEVWEWENINKVLKRHGCAAVLVSPGGDLSGGIVLDLPASQALRTAITSLVEDTERRQNLIHGLIQSSNQLKDDVRMQQERAGRQEQRAGDLQNILDAVKAKIRDLEDDFICKMRQQQGEVTSLLTEKEAAQETCRRQEEKLRQQEQSIAQLRRRLSQALAAEENRRRMRQPQENNLRDQQGYEASEDPVRERSRSGGSLDLDTTPNYKALLKSYQAQIQDARKKEEQLLRENGRLLEEMKARPSVKEFRIYKQQMKRMEKILIQNNLRCRGVTHKTREEAEPDRADVAELLPDSECHRHLQGVCRELGVQDRRNLLPAAASIYREAKTCSKLYKILSDISAVLCGPRAPPLLFRHRSRHQENGGPDAKDESDFLHLLPTIDMWAGELLSLQALRRSLMKLSQKLQPVQPAHNAAEETDGVRVEELLLLVDTMVEEAENRTQGPSVSPHVLQALVSHFQKLFDVPSASGVFPRMTEVYSKLGEMSNVMRNLRCLLGLGDTAGAGTIVTAVGRLSQEAAEGSGHRLQQILGTLDIDSIVNQIQEHEEFFPAFEELIKDLLDVLEIGHLEEIVPEVQRLKDLETQ